jgi:hypothetical protein
MFRIIITLLILASCSHRQVPPEDEALRIRAAQVKLPPSFERAEELLLKMTEKEKEKILHSYLTLRELSAGSMNPQLTNQQFFAGIPRLHIPSIEFVSEDPRNDKVSILSAAPMRNKEVLKLGTVNLIRNFEKEQVYGNFSQAPKVDALLSPEKIPQKVEEETNGKKLEDLDIFMVKSGSQEGTVRDYICAIRRNIEREYTCVESHFKEAIEELGLKMDLDQALREHKLSTTAIDNLVLRMLATMVELKIIT